MANAYGGDAAEVAEYINQRLVTPRPDCRIWAGSTESGYGRLSIDGTRYRVHRLAWESENGLIPEGLVIDHLCRIRACCNPAHMELVTPAENARRAPHTGSVKRRFRPDPSSAPSRTTCKRGHDILDPAIGAPTEAGGFRCRTCRNDAKRRWMKRRRSQAA